MEHRPNKARISMPVYPESETDTTFVFHIECECGDSDCFWVATEYKAFRNGPK
jgi:hypothetical protein